MATTKWIGGTTSSTTDWSVAANWSEAATPSTGDAVILPAAAGYGIDGYDASAALLISAVVRAGFSKTLGSAATALKLDTDAFDFAGSGVSYIDLNNCAAANITGAPAASGTGSYGLHLVGAGNTAISISPSTGSVGIASLPATTAGFTTIRVSSGTVSLGSGLTDTTENVYGGTVTSNTSPTTLNQTGGTITKESGTLGTGNISGGVLYHNSSGTITQLNVSGSGKADFSKGTLPVTVTNCNVYGNGKVYDPFGRVTWSNGIKCQQCGMSNINIGTNFTLSKGAI